MSLEFLYYFSPPKILDSYCEKLFQVGPVFLHQKSINILFQLLFKKKKNSRSPGD